jgi:alkylation response protein AidB-like acyl-CoA dehydrogenase
VLTVACHTDLDAPPHESLAVPAVPGRAHGIAIEKAPPIIGHRGALVCEISFDEVRKATLAFATAERRGGPTPVIEHQNVGMILADMKAWLQAPRTAQGPPCGSRR